MNDQVMAQNQEQPKNQQSNWSTKKNLVIIGAVGLLALPAVALAGYIFRPQSTRSLDPPALTNVTPTISPTITPSPTPITTPAPDDIPTSHTISGGTHVFQTFNNCGPASLSMALSLLGVTASQHELGDELRPNQNPNGVNDDKSVTLPELEKKAKDYGFVTYHRPNGNINLIQQFIAHDIPVITRTWLEVNEDIGHYRVVKGYHQSQEILIQDDSLQGKNLSYSYDNFKALWEAYNYEYLVLIPEDMQTIAESIIGPNIDIETAWKNALENAQQEENQNPTNIYTQFNQVVAHYNLGNYQQAVDIFEDVENQLPSRMLWYQIEPILAYYQVGNYDRVISLTNEIFNSQNRAFAELYAIRSQVHQDQGNQTAAAEALRLARQYHPNRDWEQWLDQITKAT